MAPRSSLIFRRDQMLAPTSCSPGAGARRAVGVFVGGLLIVFGLFTRPVAFILSGEMAFAYFMSHAPRGFYPIGQGGNAGELAIVYCFIFLYFFFVGAGAWSLDRVWATRSGAAGAQPSSA
jgi:putative oxidoreductase